MKLPDELEQRVVLRPGMVVSHTNLAGHRTWGIIVSEVAGTFQVAYPAWTKLRIVIGPLSDIAPIEKIEVPLGADLQPKDPAKTIQRALAMKDQRLSPLTDRSVDFVSLCVHGCKEPHYTEKLSRATRRAVLGLQVMGVAAEVGSAIGSALRSRRRRRR